MSWFMFNEFMSSSELIVTQPVIRPTWGQETNEITTASVSKIIQFSKTYGNSPLEISAVVKDTSTEALRRIYSSLRGFGKLVLSSSPTEFMYAAASVLQPQAVAQKIAELEIGFTLLPFAYALEPTVVDFTATYTEINNPGTVFSAPEIRITAAYGGDVAIDVNGAEFIVAVPDSLINKQIIIDCDSEVTYYCDGDNKISINNLTYNNYPLLHEAKNYVKYNGSLTAADINVRERWY